MEEICKGYCGVVCVSGYLCKGDCDNCFFYNGCEDCCFVDTEYCEYKEVK